MLITGSKTEHCTIDVSFENVIKALENEFMYKVGVSPECYIKNGYWVKDSPKTVTIRRVTDHEMSIWSAFDKIREELVIEEDEVE